MWTSLFSAVLALALLGACDPYYEEPGWVGLSEAQIVRDLGEPTGRSILELSRGSRLHEFQSGLYDHMPQGSEDKPLEIRELIWSGPLRTKVVWLRQREDGVWAVMETLVWYVWVNF